MKIYAPQTPEIKTSHPHSISETEPGTLRAGDRCPEAQAKPLPLRMEQSAKQEVAGRWMPVPEQRWRFYRKHLGDPGGIKARKLR